MSRLLRRLGLVLPLGAVLGLVALFAAALRQDPHTLPSALVGRPAPAIAAPLLHDAQAQFDSRSLQGRVWVLNVWASWCESCRTEHDNIKALAAEGVPVYGLNYKDTASSARAWLARWGDPYQASMLDGDGRLGMEYGVYGVPETFIIDAEGRVRYRHAGPLTEEALRMHVRPLLQELAS